MTYIDIVFSGPPSEPATFVEVENPAGRSIRVGEWLQRPDGYWVLRISSSVAPSSDAPRDGAGKPLTLNSRGEWVNEIGDTRCPNDGEFTNKRCWKCGWRRRTDEVNPSRGR